MALRKFPFWELAKAKAKAKEPRLRSGYGGQAARRLSALLELRLGNYSLKVETGQGRGLFVMTWPSVVRVMKGCGSSSLRKASPFTSQARPKARSEVVSKVIPP
jgi:hypothetical protein